MVNTPNLDLVKEVLGNTSWKADEDDNKDKIDAAFDPATGHTHDGSTPGSGPNLPTTAITGLAEFVRDTLGAALVAGSRVTITVDDAGDTITIASDDTSTAEFVRDTIGAALVAGSGISLTVDDAGNTITVASSITQYTDEMVDDRVAALLVAGAGITLTYNDGANSLTVAANATGLSWKSPVRAASTTNHTLTAPGATVDGVSLTSGDRILLKNQTTASQNGIYVWNGASSTATRDTDADTAAEILQAAMFVEEGTQADTLWVCSTNAPITLGTTSLTFVQVGSLSGGLLASNNLSDLANAGTARTNLGLGTAAIKNVPASGNAASAEVVLGNDTRLLGTTPAIPKTFGAVDAGTYLAVCHRNSDGRLRVLRTADGLTFTEITQAAVYNPPSGASLRDPSLLRYRGRWWICHTVDVGHFDVIVSDDLINWTRVTGVNSPGGYTTGNCWAPQWFVDDDGSVHVFVSLSVDTDSQHNHIFETHPTTDDLSGSWSTPVQVSGSGLPTAMIDAFVLRRNGVYYLWYKNEVTGQKYIEYASATSLTGAYTVVGSGDWASWGSGLEGMSLVHLGGSRWRIYMDKYTDLGIYYSESDDDWATWSTKALITTPWVIAHPDVHLVNDIALIRTYLASPTGIDIVGGNITSGQVLPQYLGSGTRDGTKFLRDDGSWQVPSGGGGGAGVIAMLYDSGELGAAATSIDTGAVLPTSGWDDLIIAIVSAQDGSGSGNNFELRAQVNNDSSAIYDQQISAGRNTGTQNAQQLAGTSWQIGQNSANGQAGNTEMVITGYNKTTLKKTFVASSYYQQGTASNDVMVAQHGGLWRSTAAITRFKLFVGGTGKLAIGSRLVIYGRRAAASGASDFMRYSQQILAVDTATITVPLPAGYTTAEVHIVGRSDEAATFSTVRGQVNGDSGSNYDSQGLQGNGTTASAFQDIGSSTWFMGWVAGSTAPASVPGTIKATLDDYADTNWQKSASAVSALKAANSNGNAFTLQMTNHWRSTAAITSLVLSLATGGAKFKAGTKVTLYLRS